MDTNDMTKLRLSKIHHVALIVSNYEKSKFFYSEILGMKILRENFCNDRNSFQLDLQLPNGDLVELVSFINAPPAPSTP